VTDEGAEGYELTRLASADNFRDVAGPGYLTADGVRLRTGVLFRSNELQLSDVDAGAIAALGIRDVLDLRDHPEVEAHPDVEVPGAAWTHVRVPGIPMDDVATLHSREAGLETMRRVYRVFVEDDGARAAFGELLTRLADAEHPQLFHCTAGKDRTGWASALVLRACGVPEETVVEDYLLTNRFDGTRAKYLAMVREHLGEEKVAVYETVMVADAAYLAEADAALAEQFGDLEGYLYDGLRITEGTVAALRDRLR
jgi:protein-tyrosine phosphatase